MQATVTAAQSTDTFSPELEVIERVHAMAETELEAEGTVRALIQMADERLFQLEAMVGLPEDPAYRGVLNWPARLADVTHILEKAKQGIDARKAAPGGGFNPRAAAWLRVRREKLQRAKACCRIAARLYQLVTDYNGGTLPAEPK